LGILEGIGQPAFPFIQSFPKTGDFGSWRAPEKLDEVTPFLIGF
jgi:hypothetical protein